MYWCLIALFFIALPSHARYPYEKVGWKPTLIPLVNFSSDHGADYGFRASLFRYDGRTIPYDRTLHHLQAGLSQNAANVDTHLGCSLASEDRLPSSGSWRTAAGLGLRCHWHSTIVRADLGRSGGRTGIYLNFSQVF